MEEVPCQQLPAPYLYPFTMLNTPLLIPLGRGLHRHQFTEGSTLADTVRRSIAAGRFVPGLGEALIRQHSIQVRMNAAACIHDLQIQWRNTRRGILCDFVFRAAVCLLLWHILYLSRDEGETHLRTFLWLIIALSVLNAAATFTTWFHRHRVLHVARRAQKHSGGYAVGERVMRDGSKLQCCIETCVQLSSFIAVLNWAFACYTVIFYRRELPTSDPLLYKTSLIVVVVFFFLLILPFLTGLFIMCCLGPLISFNGHRSPQAWPRAIERPEPSEQAVSITAGQSQHTTPASPVAFLPPCHLATQEVVVEANNELPQFRFRLNPAPPSASSPMPGLTPEPPKGGFMVETGSHDIRRMLPDEEAHCSVCWSNYKDGAEIQEMLCGHHFHVKCLDSWLRMTPTCPLCKEPLNPHALPEEQP